MGSYQKERVWSRLLTVGPSHQVRDMMNALVCPGSPPGPRSVTFLGMEAVVSIPQTGKQGTDVGLTPGLNWVGAAAEPDATWVHSPRAGMD